MKDNLKVEIQKKNPDAQTGWCPVITLWYVKQFYLKQLSLTQKCVQNQDMWHVLFISNKKI